MRSLIAFALLSLVAACGSVTSDGAVAGAAGAGGAAGDSTSASGGRASAAGSGGDGAAGAPGAGSAGGRAGDHGGSGGTIGTGGVQAAGGAGGSPAPCVSNNQDGFAFNSTCDGKSPASTGCHANCQLAGAHYVGCVDPSTAGPLAYYCYPSCSDCP